MHLSFPNATRVFCVKHLKDNAIVNLDKSLPQPEVTKIISKLFGESDILVSEDQITFDEIRDELTHSYDIHYLSNRLLPNLEQFAFKPRLRHPCLPRLWYNNVIKRDANWVIQKFPDLVTKLYELEYDQTSDVRGALFDKGKYVLSKQAPKFQHACALKIWFNTQIPLMSYWQTWYFISQSKRTIKVTCLFFGKPEVNRADLSCIFSLREN